MISVLLSRLVLLVFGTFYPAYASYKTVKTKNVRDYVKWMMYWIVFALYTFVEIFADIFVSFWFPFYYELKILFVLWLICPATKGSTYIFKKIVNPHLSKHEMLIDSYIESLVDNGYDLARKIGSQGVNYMFEVLLELFRKGQITAATFLPKIQEIAQTDSVITQSGQNVPVQKPADVIVIDDDEFDMLLMENQELHNEPTPVTSRRPYDNIVHEPDIESSSDNEGKPYLRKTSKAKSKPSSTVRERRKRVAK